jgi:serine/threonine protein kinase
MEDRYEIRGKIGQGGLGAVYRGYDTRMNREVAIKRIGIGDDDGGREESTKQLIKEAGALASLQHPHIVTVHDVGADEEGPYVVMELIAGKTLDELIEQAPLTWPDFRELALQTQEALIAAHERNLIHSDLKPSNLMLSWLPSGKFQVKIVDFGLATLARSQSKEELDTLDAVFGSIFFMPPEQFERHPLDERSDIYSMGCVYYQALAGCYPFGGESGAEVMFAHLNHTVKPLQEVRSDIPVWVCDWIMWQLNRNPADRPESARQCLSVFLQNDKNPNPTMSLGTAQPSGPKRPRLIIPGSDSAAAEAPPAPAAPVATPVALSAPAAVVSSLPADPVTISEVPQTKSTPQPLKPPEGAKPSVHTAPQDLPTTPEPAPVVPVRVPLAAATPVPTTAFQRGPSPTPTVAAPKKMAKARLSNAAKTMIAAVLGILAVLLAWMLIDRQSQNRETGIYNEMIQYAAKGDATELPVTKHKLDILLRSAVNVSANEHRQTIYKALYLAKATDGTDVDKAIAEFATTREMLPEVKKILIRDVIRMRKNPAVVPILIQYASTTADAPSAVAALEAVRFMAGGEQFDQFLNVIQTTTHAEVRKAAEDTAAEILRKAPSRTAFADRLATSHATAVDENIRHSFLRLLGRCGGPKALEVVRAALADTDQKNQIAAIMALGSWGDDAGFPILADYVAAATDDSLRNRAFESALRFVSDSTVEHDPKAWEEQWTMLSKQSKTRAEQEKLIRGLVNLDTDWALKLVEGYTQSDDDNIADLAVRAVENIKERRKTKSDGE